VIGVEQGGGRVGRELLDTERARQRDDRHLKTVLACLAGSPVDVVIGGHDVVLRLAGQ
jgi:hypothetical protein